MLGDVKIDVVLTVASCLFHGSGMCSSCMETGKVIIASNNSNQVNCGIFRHI